MFLSGKWLSKASRTLGLLFVTQDPKGHKFQKAIPPTIYIHFHAGLFGHMYSIGINKQDTFVCVSDNIAPIAPICDGVTSVFKVEDYFIDFLKKSDVINQLVPLN